MKFFGEFLIERELLSEHDLLAAIMDQIAATPSMPVIIFKEKLLPDRDLLNALAFQARERIDFKSACLKLNLWNDEFDIKMDRALEGARVPIGQILLQKGLISIQDLAHSLDEYFASLEQPIQAEEIAVPTVPADKQALFFELIPQKMRSQVRSELNSKNANLLAFSHIVHHIKGVAIFIGCDSLALWLDQIEKRVDGTLTPELAIGFLNIISELLKIDVQEREVKSA